MTTPLRAAALLPLLLPGALAAALEVDWNIPSNRQPYPPLAAAVGDTVTFNYDLGHNVVLHPSGSCDATNGTLLGKAGSTMSTSYTFAEAGNHTFACDVSSGVHCDLGQIITIVVSDATPSPEEDAGAGAAPEAEGGEDKEEEGAEGAGEEEEAKEEGEGEIKEDGEGGGETGEGGGEGDKATEEEGGGDVKEEDGGEEVTEEKEEVGEEDPEGGKNIFDEEEDEEEVLARYSDFFNPGEEKGLLNFQIKPYKIPHRTTTYIDFVFNIPELEELVHIVVGDVINSQPRHLHHFVLNGCTYAVDPAEEGLPLDSPNSDCNIPLGGGWASGGDFFGGIPLDAGEAFGTGLGIRALNLNVHYTDGDRPDPDRPNDGEHAIATDGFRILYTPNLRPRTVLYKPVVNVGGNVQAMNVPPAEARYFYTKTCTVEPACQDTSDARMADLYMGFTCGEIVGNCNGADADEGLYLELLCPVTCGACGGDQADDNPDPAGYHISASKYHAHLLAREMYMTLLPNARSDVPVDLESKDVWIYDFQVTYPFLDDGGGDRALRVYPGDKIQTTCVYDSTEREDTTYFDISTYDEMCINWIILLVDTPAIEADNGASLLARLNAQSFNCAIDDDSAIWGGSLEAAEDGRDIWKDHPMAEADCTFPVGSYFGQGLSLSGDTAPTFEARCATGDGPVTADFTLCNADDFLNGAVIASEEGGFTCQQVQMVVSSGQWVNFMEQEQLEFMIANEWQPRCCSGQSDSSAGEVTICGDLSLIPSAYAGDSCTGGTFDQRDSNEGTTKDQCVDGGGSFNPYTCSEIEYFINNDPKAKTFGDDTLNFLVMQWWQPKCCESTTDAATGVEKVPSTGEEGGIDDSTSKEEDAANATDEEEVTDANTLSNTEQNNGGLFNEPGEGSGDKPSQGQDGGGLSNASGELSNDGTNGEPSSGYITKLPSFLLLVPAVARFMNIL